MATEVSPRVNDYLPKSGTLRERVNVVCIVDKHRLLAHREFLGLHSKVFRDMFDVTKGSEDLLVLHKPFESYTVDEIVALLQYIYSADKLRNINRVSIDVLISLGRCADQFDMPHLHQACEEQLKTAVTDDLLYGKGALTYALLAARAKLTDLLVRCELIIAQNFTGLSQEPDLRKLPLESWQRITWMLNYKVNYSRQLPAAREVQLWFTKLYGKKSDS